MKWITSFGHSITLFKVVFLIFLERRKDDVNGNLNWYTLAFESGTL